MEFLVHEFLLEFLNFVVGTFVFETCWRGDWLFELLKDFIVLRCCRWLGTMVGGCGIEESIEADAVKRVRSQHARWLSFIHFSKKVTF